MTAHDCTVTAVKDATSTWHTGYAGRCEACDWWGDLHERQSTCLIDIENHIRETREQT